MTETLWSKGKTLVFDLRTMRCCSCRPWLVGLCSFRFLNIRKLLTRYLPILVLFGLWHFMVTTRYTRQQTRPTQLPKDGVGTPEKYRAIIARLNKERQNLHRQVVLMYQADKVSPTSGQFNEVGKKILQKKRQHSRTFRKMMLMKQKKASKEATLMDKLVEDLKKQNIPSIETYKQILGNEIYGTRIAKIISEASNAIHNASVLDDSRATNIRTSPAVIPRHAKSDQLHFTTIPRNETNLQESTNKTNYTLCDPFPPGLLGRVFVDFVHTHNMTREDVLKQHPDIEFGGTWQPPNCVARHRVAIIIPYRDREQHLVTLLSHLLPILKRQELNFHVFVTEQTGNDTFNKARIMNAAFKEAIKLYDFQCFVFHDVDLIPEDDRNMYSCPVQPRHMSVAIDEMGYRVPYDYLVGGVLSMRTEHFQMVNGYSNLYWGWGAEDDDLAFRILHVGLKITRPPSKVARYKMIKHEKRTPTDWRKRSRLLRTGVRRFNFDGLNSVNYNLISITKTPLFTHVLVDIGKPPSLT